MTDPLQAVTLDLEKYQAIEGRFTFPFPVEDFAMRVFGLDIQYEDFVQVFHSEEYDPQELFGCLFPDGRYFGGFDKVILINTNRAPLKLGDTIIHERFYIKNAERQTIAHEIGHYSYRYEQEEGEQLRMFEDNVIADSGTSIIVYPKGEEVFANKYSRLLLMPEEELRSFIVGRGLHGTIDLRESAQAFIDHFGVTQFMVEIRLNELGIRFLNGVYIRKPNRFKNQSYSAQNLLALIDLAYKYDFQPNYYDMDNMVGLYNKATGEVRASGPLYMAFWRIMRGNYDNKYPEVFERRIVTLTKLEQERIDQNRSV